MTYPRDLAPLIGGVPLDTSVRRGVVNLSAVVVDGDTVTGLSQGAVVAQIVKARLDADPNGTKNIRFITYGDPSNTDGGLLGKLPIGLPGFVTPVRANNETRYDTTTVRQEYDIMADAPDNINPVSWVNAALGGMYNHHRYTAEMATRPDNVVTTRTNSKGATQTDILVRNRGYVPIVRALHDVGVLDTRHANQVNPWVRAVVDAGYNRPKAPAAKPASTPATDTPAPQPVAQRQGTPKTKDSHQVTAGKPGKRTGTPKSTKAAKAAEHRTGSTTSK